MCFSSINIGKGWRVKQCFLVQIQMIVYRFIYNRQDFINIHYDPLHRYAMSLHSRTLFIHFNYSRKKKYGFARTTKFSSYFGSLSCSNNEMLFKDVETKLFSCNTGPRVQHLENLAANAQMTATCTKYKRKPDLLRALSDQSGSTRY